jgi:regulator of sigma E protease
VAGSPAAVAGLQAGDRILAVDGQPAIGMKAVLEAIGRDPDRLLALEVQRGDQEILVPLDLRPVPRATDFGITAARREHVAVGPAKAVVESAKLTGQFVASNIAAIGEIITGRRQFDDLGGPIRIAEVSGQTFIELGLGALVLLTALLSVNIGIVNLLPIPVLDGGHLVFLAIEAGRSRPLSPRVLKFCSLGGLLAILVIFVLITGHDLARFGMFD